MEDQKKNVIVNYIPYDMQEYELAKLFSICGEIRQTKIVRDNTSGLSLGYGFLVFATTHSAMTARILLDGHNIRGKRLKVDLARPRSKETMNANLHVALIPPSVDEDQLSTLFGHYGKIIEVKILRTGTGQSRGSGFVRFALHSSAVNAMTALNNYCFEGSNLLITVACRNRWERKIEAAAPNSSFELVNSDFN